MKKHLLIFLLIFLGFGIFAKSPNLDTTISSISESIVNIGNEKSAIIAILDFKAGTKELGVYIKDKLTSKIMEIDKNSNLKIVSRDELDKLEKETDYQYSGYVDDDTAVSLCKKIGAQVLVVGKIEEMGNEFSLTVKMVSVETAEYLFFRNFMVSSDSKIKKLLTEGEKEIEPPVMKVIKNTYTYDGDDYNETNTMLLYKSIVSFEKFRNRTYQKQYEMDITEFLTEFLKNESFKEELSIIESGNFVLAEVNSSGTKNGQPVNSKFILRCEEKKVYLNSVGFEYKE